MAPDTVEPKDFIGGAVALLGMFVTYWTGRSKGRAETQAISASADVTISTEARALVGEVRAMASEERRERQALAEQLETERRRCAEVAAELERARGEIKALRREVEALRREVRRLGGDTPGDTPPGGTKLGGDA